MMKFYQIVVFFSINASKNDYNWAPPAVVDGVVQGKN